MDDARDILRIANEWLLKGKRVCVATVVRREGSAPREVGAKMVVSSSGELAGSIGGGVVEKEIIEKAAGVMKRGKPLMVDFDLSGRAEDLDALCGGDISVFLEPFGEVKNLFIMGAGHVGMALAGLARRIGFAVTLIDDRKEFVTPDRLGEGLEGIVATPDDFEGKITLSVASFVVICTSGHSLDKQWLKTVLEFAPRYVGMLGSRVKARMVLDELEAGGVPRERLDKVHTPVGIDIGAVTPDEIAVSIAAELVRRWRKAD